jgi:hypothetical protein
LLYIVTVYKYGQNSMCLKKMCLKKRIKNSILPIIVRLSFYHYKNNLSIKIFHKNVDYLLKVLYNI